jgi:hypothetical protein
MGGFARLDGSFSWDTDVQTWIEWGALFSDKPISETTNQSGFR